MALNLKEGAVKCAKVCDESWVILENNYETALYIVLGLCLAFIVLIVVSLAIYFYSRKKIVNSHDQNPPIQRPGNEPEANDNKVI